MNRSKPQVDLAEGEASPLDIDIQFASEIEDPSALPKEAQFAAWAQRAYQAVSPNKPAEVSLRIVEAQEGQALNLAYRQKDRPTNVLSFPAELAEEVGFELLGDIVICHPVVVDEALCEQKTLHDHYAHMVTHGILHLCGYDHQNPEEADIMESLEAEILAKSGIENPYH